ncbi:MAG: hypothetical protein WCQ67_05185 [Treponema sp.]
MGKLIDGYDKLQSFWNSRFSKDGYDLVLLSDNIPEGKMSEVEK